MKHIFSFILGAMLMVAIGAFAQSYKFQFFAPATPRQVMVKHYYGKAKTAEEIQKVLSSGWVLKSCSFAITQTGIAGQAIVVYEKY